MALDAVLAAAGRRLAEAEREAKAAEDHAHLAVIGLRWNAVTAARRWCVTESGLE